jgi:hypothetical protein
MVGLTELHLNEGRCADAEPLYKRSSIAEKARSAASSAMIRTALNSLAQLVASPAAAAHRFLAIGKIQVFPPMTRATVAAIHQRKDRRRSGAGH